MGPAPTPKASAQAKEYAKKLGIRFAYGTNGQAIYEVDMADGAEGDVAAFPTPDELWDRTFASQNAWRDRFAAVPFETQRRRVGRSLLPGHRHRQRPRGGRRREEADPAHDGDRHRQDRHRGADRLEAVPAAVGT